MLKVDKIFSNRIKVVIGLVVMLVATAIDFLVGFAFGYNALVSLVAVLGLLSLTNAMFSKIFKQNIGYIEFMAANILGFAMYLYVVSMSGSLGTLFTVAFAVLVFILMWVCEMLLLKGAAPARRILGGLLINVVALLFTAIGIGVVSAVSVIKDML